MSSTQSNQWRAGRFWWDQESGALAPVIAPSGRPLRAVIFDLDALADMEFEGNRIAFNAAFAAHDVPISWSVAEYRRLLAISDERRRVEAGLCRRGFEPGLLTDLLADEITMTKAQLFGELILDTGLAPRVGLVDLVMDAYLAGVWVAVVTSGQRRWAEPLVRQLVGDGLVETVVTADDVTRPAPDSELYAFALWELGIPAEEALAVAGSAPGLRTACSAGLATVAIIGSTTLLPRGAVAVRPDYAGADALLLADCRRLHQTWWSTHKCLPVAA